MFIADMMSSEESDPEDENIMIVKELPFRHERVGAYFHAIDIAANKKNTFTGIATDEKACLEGCLIAQHRLEFPNGRLWLVTAVRTYSCFLLRD